MLSVVEHHFIDFRPFESRENIVFVGLDEAVGRRGDVVGARECQRMLREVAWQILLFVERIGEFAFVIGLFRVESVGDIARRKQVRIEVGGGLSRESEAESVDEVARDGRIDGADVEFRGFSRRTGLDEVLDEGFQAKKHVFEAFELFDSMDERVHRRLRLREFHRAVLVPERLVAPHGIGLVPLVDPALEKLLGNRREIVVREACRANDDGL